MKKSVIALCVVGAASLLAVSNVAVAQTASKTTAEAKSAAAKKAAPAKRKVVRKTKQKTNTTKTTKRASVLAVNPVTGYNAPATPVAPAAGVPFPAPSLPVYTGVSQCEFNTNVTITPSVISPNQFTVVSGRRTFTMDRVPTTTGVVRLEDKVQGVTWLQLGNKSMLMDQRRGERLADNCQDAQQKLRDEELKKAPQAPAF